MSAAYIVFIFLFCTVTANDFYRTLLYGSNFHGFLKITLLQEDEYMVSFESDQNTTNMRWAVHTSSAPYDMAVMEDNCKRVKKSPHVLRNLPLDDTSVTGSQIIGYTVVVSTEDKIEACATVILPEKPLLAISVHSEPIEGHIHVIQTDDQVRLLPDLRYMQKYDHIEPEKEIFTWAFVDSCDSANESQVSDGSELGIDSRTTISFQLASNYTIKSLALLRQNKVFYCQEISIVEPRIVMALNAGFSQQNYYQPVYGITPRTPQKLRIRDDCLDISTESVHEKYENFYPSVNIFGPESMMLKSIYYEECSVLRPQFPRPASTAYFIHPIIGRLTIVDTEDKILLTGELRHVFEDMSSRATVQVSSEPTGPTGCPENHQCEDCHMVQDAAIIVGRNKDAVSLSGVLPWFPIQSVKSVVVDMEWTKVCANLTFLPNGAISAHALFQRVSPISASTVASIVALEYPANNYTEVLVNKRQPFTNAVAHMRPIDASITTGPPCGEQNLGPVKQVFWTQRLKSILGSELNDTSVFIWFNMVTGLHSVLGTSVILSDENEVYCGDFEPLTEKTIAVAVFQEPFEGYIKLTQYSSSNWASGLPTQVYYSLADANQTLLTETNELVDWDIVSTEDSLCKNSVLFNPFQVNETECNLVRSSFCPVGSATLKSSALMFNARRHILIHDLPLTGPYSVVGKSIRLRSTNDSKIACAEIKEYSEATFRWIALSESSLQKVQSEFASRVNVSEFQVQVDFTRISYGSLCNIFRITLLASDETLALVLDKFDVEQKKFKTDEDLFCGATKEVLDQKAESSRNPQNASTSTGILISLIAVFSVVIFAF